MGVDKKEAVPRLRSKPYAPYFWVTGHVTEFNSPIKDLTVDLVRLSGSRMSRRQFDLLPMNKLGDLLWLCCRAHSTIPSNFGFEQQFRPVPSAGAIHPIHILVQRSFQECWEIYDPERHALAAISTSEAMACAARQQANGIISCLNATLLLLVAEPGKTNAKYSNPESLIWRDAGVIIGALVTYAEALELSVCPLGATGNSYVAPLAAAGVLVGAGMLLVGARA